MLFIGLFGALDCGGSRLSSDDAGAPSPADASAQADQLVMPDVGTHDASPEAGAPDASSDGETVAAVSCKTLTLPAAVQSAGYVNNVFCDDFSDLTTIDLADTQTAGFNWYIASISEGTVGDPSRLSTVHVGPITALRLDGAGSGVGGSSVTKGTRDPIGVSFGQRKNGGAYFEANLAMRMPDSIAGQAFPAFWVSSTLHQQAKTVTWAGQSNPAYEHYIEVDFMELESSTNGDYRSTVIDWFGQWDKVTPTCNSLTYCKGQDSQPLGPGVLGTFDSTEAHPIFHRYGALWIPSVQSDDAGPYSTGSIQWLLDGNPIGVAVTWVGPPSTTMLDLTPSPPWKYSILDQQQVSLVFDTASNAFMYVDYVGVWQLP
jgi:hypothetical protein